jgi:hypothetical protein
MALNVTFTCNQIVDENDNPINCKYQVYYPDYSKWNTVRDTEFYQYNCNAGDGDSLTQSGSFLSGDKAVIVFWQNGNDRTGLKDRMAWYTITHDGITSVYNIDVQLKPKMDPTCSWSLTSSSLKDQQVTATSFADDEDTWYYNGTLMRHQRKYGSEVILPSIEVMTITYDFGAGDLWQSSNQYTYDTVADYTAKHKVLNAYGQTAECTKSIRVKYNSPVGSISFTPDGVGGGDLVYMNDSVNVAANITDIDSRITSIEHHFVVKDKNNNSNWLVDTTEGNNTDLTFDYDKTIPSLDDVFGYQYIYWNDGWGDLIVTYNRELTITNTLPTVSIFKTDLSSKQKRFAQTSNDLDGSVVSWEWEIFLEMPFGAGWTSVWDDTNSGEDIDVQFTASGHYKTVLTVTDDVGGQATTEVEYDITADGTTTGTCSGFGNDLYFIFPDVIDVTT